MVISQRRGRESERGGQSRNESDEGQKSSRSRAAVGNERGAWGRQAEEKS